MKLTNRIAAFYLGCKVQCIFPEEVAFATMTSVSEEWMAFDGQIPDYYFDAEEDENQGNGFKVKLILRRLQDITEGEFNQMKAQGWVGARSVRHWMRQPSSLIYSAEQLAYLLSKSFDLFGLMDSGEAIDSKTLTDSTNNKPK